MKYPCFTRLISDEVLTRPKVVDLRLQTDAFFRGIDLCGRDLLDIGCNNGFFNFETPKRGHRRVRRELPVPEPGEWTMYANRRPYQDDASSQQCTTSVSTTEVRHGSRHSRIKDLTPESERV